MEPEKWVYVVTQVYDYEGEEVRAVCLTQEEAEAFARQVVAEKWVDGAKVFRVEMGKLYGSIELAPVLVLDGDRT